MAEYKLPYTAADISNRLGKVNTISAEIETLKNDFNNSNLSELNNKVNQLTSTIQSTVKTQAQSLTSEEKTQARTNIGAASNTYVEGEFSSIQNSINSLERDVNSLETTHANDKAVLENKVDGKVPLTRTVNGKALSSDITLSARDIDGVVVAEEKAAANGVASLGADGKIPVEQLPMLNPANGISYDVYVNAIAGSDTTADGTRAHPFKTVQKALDSIPKNLNGCFTYIYIGGDSTTVYEEDVNIEGFRGGLLTIRPDNNDNAPTIRGNILASQTQAILFSEIRVEGKITCSYCSYVYAASCMVESEDAFAVKVANCGAVMVRDGTLEATGSVNYRGAFQSQYSFCSLANVTITEATPIGICAIYGGVCFVTDCTNNAKAKTATYQARIYE